MVPTRSLEQYKSASFQPFLFRLFCTVGIAVTGLTITFCLYTAYHIVFSLFVWSQSSFKHLNDGSVLTIPHRVLCFVLHSYLNRLMFFIIHADSRLWSLLLSWCTVKCWCAFMPKRAYALIISRSQTQTFPFVIHWFFNPLSNHICPSSLFCPSPFFLFAPPSSSPGLRGPSASNSALSVK